MATDPGKRVHVERAGVVRMALPAAEALPLFSAEGGERRWVAGWDRGRLMTRKRPPNAIAKQIQNSTASADQLS